ncbi:hypothetical protein ASD62_18385 [Phycicoccus sp. Root563]|uniref:PH domain-containing protein n=1 Tax=Phycicoccus sp. Root563 TaxID=1736562 RepID=UPI0007038423|nr:PH domain-containing protein [Phycicoccus sp. Root563]KQZ87536.1 hypothetical protein ASD62_18385 [Phycicoccus sp. Root563]
MVNDRAGTEIEGMHRLPALVWTAVVAPLSMIGVGVVLVAVTDLGWGALLAGVLFGLPMVLRWWNRTVVSPEGIRTRRWLRWRVLPWEDIAAVAEAGRWTWDDVVGVITEHGEPVALDLPGSRRAEFSDYAASRGVPRDARSRGRRAAG